LRSPQLEVCLRGRLWHQYMETLSVMVEASSAAQGICRSMMVERKKVVAVL